MGDATHHEIPKKRLFPDPELKGKGRSRSVSASPTTVGAAPQQPATVSSNYNIATQLPGGDSQRSMGSIANLELFCSNDALVELLSEIALTVEKKAGKQWGRSEEIPAKFASLCLWCVTVFPIYSLQSWREVETGAMVGGGLAMEGMEQRNHKKGRLAKSSQASPEHGLVKLQVADGRASSCIFVLVFCLL